MVACKWHPSENSMAVSFQPMLYSLNIVYTYRYSLEYYNENNQLDGCYYGTLPPLKHLALAI